MNQHDDLIAAYREFISQNTLRFERAMRSLAAEIRSEVQLARKELRNDIRLQREESRAYFEQQSRRLDDLLEENRAQRKALLHILDKLDNGGAAPA